MFQSLPALPADPILGLMASYRADSNPKKIDLGIGVYKNETGDTPVMTAVKESRGHDSRFADDEKLCGPNWRCWL